MDGHVTVIIWPVSFSHFCHLIDVTPVWKMSSAITGIPQVVCMQHALLFFQVDLMTAHPWTQWSVSTQRPMSGRWSLAWQHVAVEWDSVHLVDGSTLWVAMTASTTSTLWKLMTQIPTGKSVGDKQKKICSICLQSRNLVWTWILYSVLWEICITPHIGNWFLMSSQQNRSYQDE